MASCFPSHHSPVKLFSLRESPWLEGPGCPPFLLVARVAPETPSCRRVSGMVGSGDHGCAGPQPGQGGGVRLTFQAQAEGEEICPSSAPQSFRTTESIDVKPRALRDFEVGQRSWPGVGVDHCNLLAADDPARRFCHILCRHSPRETKHAVPTPCFTATGHWRRIAGGWGLIGRIRA